MDAKKMRSGAAEQMEFTGGGAKEQEALNGTTAKSTPDHVSADNKTSKHLESGKAPGPYGAKGHVGG